MDFQNPELMRFPESIKKLKRWTQNPVELKLRAGSTPAFGTIYDKDYRAWNKKAMLCFFIFDHHFDHLKTEHYF